MRQFKLRTDRLIENQNPTPGSLSLLPPLLFHPFHLLAQSLPLLDRDLGLGIPKRDVRI